MPGFKREILVNDSDLNDRLLCYICKLLLKAAVQSMCGHRYCDSCVKDRFASFDSGAEIRCPACPPDSEDGIWNEKEIYPDFHARKELKSLKVKCPNQGCNWKGTFQQYTDHEPACDLEPVKCKKPGCGRSLRRGDLAYHYEKDCPVRPMKCRYCGQESPYNQMKKHNAECPKVSILCTDCNKKVPRDALTTHQDFDTGDCPNRKQRCPYANYGCQITIAGSGMYEHLQTEAVFHTELQNRKFEELIGHMENIVLSDPLQKHSEKSNRSDQIKSDIKSSSPKKGKVVIDAEPLEGYVAADAIPTDEAAYMQLPQESKFTISDVELSRLKMIFKKMFVSKDEDGDGDTKLASRSGSNNSPNTPRSAANRGLDKKIKEVEGKIKDSAKEMEQLRTLYAVLDKRNETFQEVVAMLNNQMEQLAEKANNLERQNRHLKETIDQLDRQIHAHDQMLTVKNVALAEQELRIQSLESSSFNGILIWKISEYARRRRDAVSGKTTSFYSPAFYTSYHGYKMCARIYLNGDGMGKGTHVSLFFVVMKGRYDNILRWPFRQKVTFMMVDQGNREHVVDAFRPDPTSSSFKKPTNEMNIASGCPLFVSLSLLENTNYSYVKDDCLFVKVVVDVTDLERI